MDIRRCCIPYRIPEGLPCFYEDKVKGKDPCVRMCDMVAVPFDERIDDRVTGELCGVHYDDDCFIDSVDLYDEETGVVSEVDCDGVFYRGEE